MKRALGMVTAIGLVSCRPDVVVQTFLAPLDGQTGIPEDLDLVATTGHVEFPPDYVDGAIVRVSDLTEGVPVGGDIAIEQSVVRFTPDEPWLADHRYSWTLDPPEEVPHGPDIGFPENLAGTAVFGTGDDIAVLSAVLVGENVLCVVLSRPLLTDEWTPVRVTADDVELEKVDFEPLASEEWGEEYELDSADPGVDAGCAVLTTTLETGSAVRIWWDGHGPWRFLVEAGTVEGAMRELRRGSD